MPKPVANEVLNPEVTVKYPPDCKRTMPDTCHPLAITRSVRLGKLRRLVHSWTY